MSLILQIETATTCCSIALAKDGVVLAIKEADERGIHAKMITLFINDVITASNSQYSDIDAVAVSSGPGSYTGLRIGISTAKGLCFALDKPLIAVETLESMVYAVMDHPALLFNENALLCPMIDARRMEVYTAVYSNFGERIKCTSAEIVTADSFRNLLENQRMLFFGDGAEKCMEILGKDPNAIFSTGFFNSASSLTKRAFEKFKNKEFEDMAHFEPYYLKDFITGNKAI